VLDHRAQLERLRQWWGAKNDSCWHTYLIISKDVSGVSVISLDITYIEVASSEFYKEFIAFSGSVSERLWSRSISNVTTKKSICAICAREGRALAEDTHGFEFPWGALSGRSILFSALPGGGWQATVGPPFVLSHFVCVCERERETERARARARERERERETSHCPQTQI
jgi:hypothetical protein